jgi:hypothetical protein
MASKKRKYRWVLKGLGALFLFLLILALLLPRLINLESVSGKILAAASQAVGGQLTCEKIDFSLIPRPRVAIHNGSLSIPGELTGHSDYFAVYPEVLPLFIGKLRLSRVHVKDPVFTYEVGKEKPATTAEKPKPVSPANILEELDPFMALLASKSPNLIIHLENGRMTLAMEHELVFQYQDLRAQTNIPDKKIAVDITDFNLAIAELGHQHTKKQESAPHEVAPDGDKKLVIRGKRLRTALDVSEDKQTLSLKELNLDHPQLNLSGRFILNRASPPIRLELEGRELDIHSTREVALALAGDDSTVRDIFDILKGGKIPQITFSSHGKSLDDLGDSENMLIAGVLVDGKVSIPDVDLNLKDVNGETHISKGILHGKNLDGRLGNTQARNGILKLGLEGDDALFHLDILVDADLAQLPPILKRLINDKSFVHELNLIDHFEGNASGRLVLGESLASIDAIVDVSEFNLSAKYQRTPFPLEIAGGGFYYDATRIDLEKVSVKLGKSLLTDLSAGLDLSEEYYLKAELGNSEIFLEEFFPWLLSLELYSGMRNDFRSVKGKLTLSASLDGPLLKFESWKYEARGELTDLALDTPLLPWPVKVTRGSGDVIETLTEQRFSLRDFQVSALDGSLNASGVIKDYIKKGVNNADITFQGSLGPQATQWVSELIHLPPEIRISPPVSFSKANLAWEKNAKTSFVGDLVVNNGPKVSIDFLQTPKELMLKNLIVQDESSHAAMKLSLKQRELSAGFRGKLTEKTIREIHQGYQLLHGSIKGDFRTRISLDPPMRSTAQGRLIAQDVILPLDLKMPLKIDSISLAGQENKVKIESAVCTWGDSTMDLRGNLSSAETDLLVDMDITTELLDLNKIIEALSEDAKSKDPKETSASWDLPLRGTIRLKSKNLTYEGLNWSPVHADISLKRAAIGVDVTEANLCGIATPGNLEITAQDLQLDFEPVSKKQEFDATYDCLWGKTGVATGHFDLEGKISAQVKSEDIVRSSQGNIAFLAHDGRIYHDKEFGILTGVFARLSVAEMFKGKLPDMKKEGFPYKSIEIKAKLAGGKLTLQKAVIVGEGTQIFAHGDIDLVHEKLDLEVAVAPFKTVDTVVKHTPVFGKIFGGKLVSVPVKVTGDWAEPEVKAMAASSVGSGLLGIIKRTVEYPIDLVQPLNNEEKEK